MSGTEVIRVALVDDQELVRRGIGMVLGLEDDIEVVAEAADGRAAIDLVRTTDVDVVLMDVQMPEVDGLEAARRILTSRPETRVLVLTTFERDDYIFEALRSGASGFLLKNAPPEELIDAVRIVTSGEALLSPSVTRRVIGAFSRLNPPTGVEPPELATLTERERDVLGRVAEGLSNAEIAEALFVGEATVKTHVSNVLSKLHLRDRVQAVVYAHRHGLV